MANRNSNCICINCSSDLNSISSTYYELSSEFKIRPNRSNLRSGVSDSSWKKNLTVRQALDFIFQVTDQYDDDSMDFSNYRLCNGCMTIFSPLFQLYLQFISATGKDSPIHKVLHNGQLRRELNDMIFTSIEDENSSSCNTGHNTQESNLQSSESVLTSEANDISDIAQELVEVLEVKPEEEYKSDVFADTDLGENLEGLEPKCSPTENQNVRMGNRQIPNQMKSSTKRGISIRGKKRILKCRKCNETFRSMPNLTKHSVVHRGEATFRCLICNCGFTTRDRKLTHMFKLHPEIHRKTFINCEWCRGRSRRRFTSRVLFKRHLVKKHFHCSTCQLTFPTTEEINSHMVAVHGSDWMKHDCEFCDYKSNNLQQFKDHQRRLHSTGGKKLTCEVCGKTFKTPGLLNFHARFHSKGKFMCDECGVTYHRQINLTNHKLAVHPSGKMSMEDAPEMHNQCGICMERFTTPEYLRRHVVVHSATGDGKYKCMICKCDFNTSKPYRQHMVKMHPDQTTFKKTNYDFHCPLCSLKLCSEIYLNQHLVRHHFYCPICKHISTTIEDINSHVETQHGSDCLKFACEFCEFKTGFHISLRSHRLAKHLAEEGGSTCEICGKIFKNTYTLKMHQVRNSHSDERPFKCDQCEKSYHRQVNLTNHKLFIHSRVERENLGLGSENAPEMHNQCGKCSEIFTTEEFLRLHAVVHTDTGEGEYKCTICNCDFSTSMCQQKHMLKMHPETRIKEIGDKMIRSDSTCHLCNKKFFSEVHLKQHLVCYHFHCPVCQQTSTTVEDINSHVETQHGSDCLKFACEFCEYKTGFHISFRSHRAKHLSAGGESSCKRKAYGKTKTTSGLRHHQVLNSRSNERQFKCDQCERSYYRLVSLTNHKLAVHPRVESENVATEDGQEMYNQCGKCGERFTAPEFLRMHAKVHTDTGDGKYKCTICNCDFTTGMRQQKHMVKMHPETRPTRTRAISGKIPDFPCHLCDKKLSSEVHLKQHLVRVHFHCPVCQQTSTTIDDINSHMETQHGPNCLNFVCEFCEYATKAYNRLQYHRLAKHSTEEGQQLTCEVCGKEFRIMSALRVHQVSHSDERPFKCDLCEMTYKRSAGLSSHKQAIHFPLKLICEICGHVSNEMSNFKKHIRRSHRGIKQNQNNVRKGGVKKKKRSKLPKK